MEIIPTTLSSKTGTCRICLSVISSIARRILVLLDTVINLSSSVMIS
uniref:Uncharacterized protein n=1 Tax=Arundo donax TaxID=35708 RepID=A0A0A9CW77_ARUDO